MMTRWVSTTSPLVGVLFTFTGCMTAGGLPGSGDSTGDASVVSDVAAKSTRVASGVGGASGFGGTLMDGYLEHMPPQMGFSSQADLAAADDNIMVRLHNEAGEHCEFHLTYFASHMGLEDQLIDVEVDAGEAVTVDVPCAEIMGLGSLETPGDAGCHLVTGDAISNTLAVPGFLGQDYTCGGAYEIFLTTDVDDLDGDGDADELILLSDGMRLHLMDGGPLGHMHGLGPGMMRHHMRGMGFR